ncbi:hypothetical protein ABPG74_022064 [Tetrahymena malaccensis]
MSSSDQSQSKKPQIFINHVDQSIKEEDIQKACENKNTKPISVTIRNNHDQKSNNVNITFATENEAKILKGSDSILEVNGHSLKLEEFQTICPPNVFLKNNYGFTEEQIQEGIKAIVKNYFHISVSNNLVNIYVQETEDQNLLINHQHQIQGKNVRFEKFQKNHSNKQNIQDQLFIKVSNHSAASTSEIQDYLKSKFNSAQITVFNAVDKSFIATDKSVPQSQSTYFSVILGDEALAQSFYKELKETQKILNYNVNVSWKRPENSEDRTLVLKFLREDVTDEQIKEVFKQFGKVSHLELTNFVQTKTDKPQTKSAYLMMANEESCKNIMSEAYKNLQVKQLFNLQKPSISPYIPKNDIINYKHAVKSNETTFPNTQIQLNQSQAMYPPQAFYQQQMVFLNQFQNQFYPFQNQNPQFKQQTPYMNQQGRPQQKQQYPQHNKRFNHHHGNHGHQQYYNQYNQVQNGGNNYIKNQNQQGHKHQQPQQYTKESLQQILAQNPQNFDKIIHQHARQIISSKLRANKKLDNYNQYVDKIVEMITDKDTFSQIEIIETITDEKEIVERIDEALELIQQNAQAKN